MEAKKFQGRVGALRRPDGPGRYVFGPPGSKENKGLLSPSFAKASEDRPALSSVRLRRSFGGQGGGGGEAATEESAQGPQNTYAGRPYSMLFRKAAVLVCLLGAGFCLQAADFTGKKLIEFGWDEPGTDFLRAHITELQKTPFDGCVFHVDYKKTNGVTGSFTWQCWSGEAFTATDLAGAFADLRAVRFGAFKNNFLRFNTTPARIDWFDDYTTVLTNATLAARLAKAGHCPGILFDIEQYEGPLFNYRKQRDSGKKSWELYAAQARVRGRQVMEAFQAGYPSLTVFLTFGYCLPWAQSRAGRVSLADCDYGLLAPFLDGMVEAAARSARLVDGYERAYGYLRAEEFDAARKAVKQELLPIVRDPDKYRRVFSLAFGIWLDKDWRKRGWETNDFSKNYFTPEALETSVRAALTAADEYVWIYSETPRWWSAEGGPVLLPAAYEAALRKGRQARP